MFQDLSDAFDKDTIYNLYLFYTKASNYLLNLNSFGGSYLWHD